MLKMLKRRITLQLLSSYSLFILPLLLMGMELYFFERDLSQQKTMQNPIAFVAFEHTLMLLLVTLVIGASLFWFMLSDNW